MPDPHTLDDLMRSARGDGAVATSPRSELSVEDLRVLVARERSLDRYVPQAIDLLEQNMLAEGDYYPGDLLQAVLDVDVTYWRAHRDQWERVDEIVETFMFAQGRLSAALQAFRARRV
jgi:CDI immunity proteins